MKFASDNEKKFREKHYHDQCFLIDKNRNTFPRIYFA